MATWFIRLGAKHQPESRALYEDFARNHNLIKIGYGIDEDITQKKKKEIEKYLRQNPRYTEGQIRVRTWLIDNFINGIKKGDTIISPIGRSKKYIIGLVVSDCSTVQYFFKDEPEKLANLIKKHKYSDEQYDLKIKPAIKVKWEKKELNLEDFTKEIKLALKNIMPATITRLKVDEEEGYKKFIDGFKKIKEYREEIEEVDGIASKWKSFIEWHFKFSDKKILYWIGVGLAIIVPFLSAVESLINIYNFLFTDETIKEYFLIFGWRGMLG